MVDQLRCSKCATLLKLPASFQGAAVRCPKCKGVIAIANKEVAITVQHDLQPHPRARAAQREPSPSLMYNPIVWLFGGLALSLCCLPICVAVALAFIGNAPEVPPPPRPLKKVAQVQVAAEPNDQAVPRMQQEPPLATRKEKPAVSVPKNPTPMPVAQLPLPPRDVRPHLVLNPGGHSSFVRGLAFSSTGRELVSVSADKLIRVWDVATGETRHVLHLPIGPGSEGDHTALDVSSDGKTLAVSSIPYGNGRYGMMVYLISLDDGRVQRVLSGHRGPVLDVDFSPDGRFLATGSADNTARLFDVQTGESVREFAGHSAPIRRVAFAPNGKLLATSCMDDVARIWSVDNGGSLAVLKRPGRILTVEWNPLERMLATGCVDGTIQTWSVDGRLLSENRIEPGEKIQAPFLAFHPDGTQLLYGGIDFVGRAGIFDVTTGKQVHAFKRHNNTVTAVEFSPDGLLAATAGGNDNEIYIWRTADGQVSQKLQGSGRAVFAVGWSPDSKYLAWGNTNRGDTVKAQARLESTFGLADLGFGPDPGPDYVRYTNTANGYALEAIDFYRLAIRRNGQLLHTFRTPDQSRIYSFSIVSEDRAIIGGSFGLWLIDLPSARVLRQYHGHSGIVFGVSPSPDGRYFLTGSIDQTLRIWRYDQEEPLLSLFVSGSEWIAWTPHGFYAASPYGERLMGWQLNNGPREMATYHPAVRFRRSLYAPDMLTHLFDSGDSIKAIALANRDRPAKIAPLSLIDVLPPKVDISLPSSLNVRIDKGTIKVDAVAHSSGKYPVTALRLLLDGRPYQGARGVRRIEQPKLGEAAASWDVDLHPGKHIITVQAESDVSSAVSRPLTVERTGAKADELPNLYVLAAGISAYPGRLRLQYAAADAEAIVQAFRANAPGVFRNVETKTLLDKEATGKEIVKGLAWLKGKMTANDVGVIFFAGHGAKDAREFFLVPVDADPRRLAETGVPGELLKKALEEMPGRLIAVLDACHSGEAASQKLLAAADDLVRDLVTEDYGVIVMSSSLGREFSLESPKVKHGFFTYSLIEGISGMADANGDRFVYLHEADSYTARRVQELTQGVQNPTSGRPPGILSFPLSQVKMP